MEKNIIGPNTNIIFLFGFLLLTACNKLNDRPGEKGFLEGKITIGPICPVQTDPPDPGCLPTAETYKAYPVSIWTSDAKKKIREINPLLNGSYTTELPPGEYLVILEKDQLGPGGSNLPVLISIISNNTTLLNINIDTGIR